MLGVLVAVGGATLYTIVIFQVLLGRRVIKLPPKIHFKVHKWIGYGLLVVAPIHGLFGTSVFLGWPFQI